MTNLTITLRVYKITVAIVDKMFAIVVIKSMLFSALMQDQRHLKQCNHNNNNTKNI